MNPETIVRAYLRTTVAEREGWQGPRRRKATRQRDTFLSWLERWANERRQVDLCLGVRKLAEGEL